MTDKKCGWCGKSATVPIEWDQFGMRWHGHVCPGCAELLGAKIDNILSSIDAESVEPIPAGRGEQEVNDETT